jgi:uncharacterized protein
LSLYLDTSALVKLYVEEDGSTLVRGWVHDADVVATSIFAYAEARAAFARRRREKQIAPAAYTQILREFEPDWGHYVVLDATDSLIRSAGRLAEVYALRAYDAIHLASAKILKDKVAPPVSFASWDPRLTVAALKEGLDAVLRHEH